MYMEASQSTASAAPEQKAHTTTPFKRGASTHHDEAESAQAHKKKRIEASPVQSSLAAQHRKGPLPSHAERHSPLLHASKPHSPSKDRQQAQYAAHAAAASSPSATSTASRLYHPFKANFNDHFETSTAALQDVLPFVNELRQLLRPSTPEKLTLYDPYYCSGAVVDAWHGLGVHHVLHENRDFYADIAHDTLPGPYDVLVTNPPFSEDHIWRLLDFLATHPPLKPWAFVAPDYIAAKPQYKAWVQRYFTPTAIVPSPGPTGAVKGAVRRPSPAPIPSIEAILPSFLLPAEAEETATTESITTTTTPGPAQHQHTRSAFVTTPVGPEPFYIIPRTRYDYAHPLGVGHDHSHFKSMWYVWAGRHTNEVRRGVSVALSRFSGGAPVTVVNGYQSLVEGHYVSATGRRVNPRRRQRAMGGGGGGGPGSSRGDRSGRR